jgi:hypothetical protein
MIFAAVGAFAVLLMAFAVLPTFIQRHHARLDED